MMEFEEGIRIRLKCLREEKFNYGSRKKKDFAKEILEWSPQLWGKFENTGRGSLRNFVYIAKKTQVPIEWLLLGEGPTDIRYPRLPQPGLTDFDFKQYAIIPLFQEKDIVNLMPTPMVEKGKTNEWAIIPKMFINPGNVAIGIELNFDHHMSPTLKTLDTIAIDFTNKEIVKGGIYVLRKQEDSYPFSIRYLHHFEKSGRITARAEDHAMGIMEIDHSDIVARVVWCCRKLGE